MGVQGARVEVVPLLDENQDLYQRDNMEFEVIYRYLYVYLEAAHLLRRRTKCKRKCECMDIVL